MGINASRSTKRAFWLDYDPDDRPIMQDIDWGHIKPHPALLFPVPRERLKSINPQKRVVTRVL